MQFEWDPNKARANETKHGISFNEASEVFGDEHASSVQDPDHSLDEERHLLLMPTTKVQCAEFLELRSIFRSDASENRPTQTFGNGLSPTQTAVANVPLTGVEH